MKKCFFVILHPSTAINDTKRPRCCSLCAIIKGWLKQWNRKARLIEVIITLVLMGNLQMIRC